MVGIIKKLHSPKKYLLPNAVLFLQIGANVQFWSVKISKWAHFGEIIYKSEAIPQNPSLAYGGHYLEAPFSLKIFAPKCSAFSANWCKCPILVG